MSIDKSTLLDIISKFPNKESRIELRNILSNSSKDLMWRNNISHIFYLLNKLEEVIVTKEELTEELTEEVIEVQEQELQPEEQVQEELEEQVQEIVHELTDIEKIQLQYEEKVRNILQNT